MGEEFEKEFKKRGGTVKSFDGIAIGDKDFKALLTRLKSLKPDALYFGGIYNEGGLIAKQAKELGLNATLVSGDAAQSPEFFKVAGSAAEGAYVTNVGVPPERIASAKNFLEDYASEYPGKDMQPYDHYTYEAMRIALLALEEAGIADPASNRIDKSKIIEYLKILKYDGVLGHTEFDEKGDTKNKAVTVYLVKSGKFVPVN